MLLLLLLATNGARSHQITITDDVTTDSDDVCISGCYCSATAVVCQRDNVLKSFPLLPSAAAFNITDM